jgi:hypothetical protein
VIGVNHIGTFYLTQVSHAPFLQAHFSKASLLNLLRGSRRQYFSCDLALFGAAVAATLSSSFLVPLTLLLDL